MEAWDEGGDGGRGARAADIPQALGRLSLRPFFGKRRVYREMALVAARLDAGRGSTLAMVVGQGVFKLASSCGESAASCGLPGQQEGNFVKGYMIDIT